jgi:hypothetical protein
VPLRKFVPFKAGPVLVESPQHPAEPKNFWRTSLLLATSAALGGIAVAIWNRRILAQIRQQIPPDEQD